jgi:hypothetical protein
MLIVIVLLVALVTAGVITHSFTKQNDVEETPAAPEKVEPQQPVVTHKHNLDFTNLPSVSAEGSINKVTSTLTVTPEPKKKVVVPANPAPKPKAAPAKAPQPARHKLSATPASAQKKGTSNKK